MTHEDSGETVRTGNTPGRRNITAKFLRQKVAWHNREKCQDQYGWRRVHGGVNRVYRGEG